MPAAELHAATLIEQTDSEDVSTPNTELDADGLPTSSKSNVDIIDDPANQKLTMAEIEALKRYETGSGRELIEKIIQSHSSLDRKTAFSLAKYTLRKHKKYIKRFCVLPLDVATLTDWVMTERDFAKVMEVRNEVIGLIGCWANVHADSNPSVDDLSPVEPSSRYLVVDDTGGLIVAAMAERMGILHQTDYEAAALTTEEDHVSGEMELPPDSPASPHKPRRQQYHRVAMSATSNAITVVHANQQPNLALLRYFNFDSNNPTSSHPLYTHLKTLSWLQLIEPESDITCREPDLIPSEELARLKPNKRGAYYRKRRRWERTRNIMDETRAGGFNGLIVVSFTNPVSILHHLVPLLAGGSQVVVFSPHVEPLAELADFYSTARRTAYLSAPEGQRRVPSDDFPVDPSLLLVPMVQTARVRRWQVLPGRTHPLMTGRGGGDGYLFVATRVLPAEGKVTARGRPPRGKKSKAKDEDEEGGGGGGDERKIETKDVLSASPSKKQKVSSQDTISAMEDVAAEADIDLADGAANG